MLNFEPILFKLLVFGGFLILFLIAVEFLLGHFGGRFFGRVYGGGVRLSERGEYAVETSLRLAGMVMTVVLNVLVLLIFFWCLLFVLFGVLYAMRYIILIFVVALLILTLTLLFCVREIIRYNNAGM